MREGARRARAARATSTAARSATACAAPLVRPLRKQGQAQRRLQLVELRQSAVHPDELQGRRLFAMSTRSRTRRATRCTPGTRSSTQPFQTYDYPIFLAEVASTFNEELLTHHLLETDHRSQDARLPHQSADRRHPRHGLSADDVRGVRKAHRTRWRKRGEPLTLDTFRKAYRGLLDAYFGPDFAHRRGAGARMPAHPAFLQRLLRLQIRHRHQRRGRAFASRCSMTRRRGALPRLPAQRRLEVSDPHAAGGGVDMSKPAPVEATLRLFARRVEELEELLG